MSAYGSYRWQTRERADEQPYSYHPYAYALSDPVLLTDPTGYCSRTGDDYCFPDQRDPSGNSAAGTVITAPPPPVYIPTTDYIPGTDYVPAPEPAPVSAIGTWLGRACFLLAVAVTLTGDQAQPDSTPFDKDPDKDQYAYFVHGTTTALWGSSSSVQAIGRGGDFGRGFYTFMVNGANPGWDIRSATTWARTRASSGGSPILVFLRMRWSDLATLQRFDVDDANYTATVAQWWPSATTGYDLIVGHVGKRGMGRNDRIPDYTLPQQYKFEGTKSFSRLEVRAIVPIK